MLGIQVSDGTSRRYTEAAGAAYEQMQEEEVERLEKEMPEAEKGAEKLQISADGAMVPLLHGVWAEVRTVVIGEVQPAVEERGERVVHTQNLSYFSRKVNSKAFERLALCETQRRGVEQAQEVAAIMDGADWLQGFTDYHCPGATRILDFPHAAEHVSKIGEFLHGEHITENQHWLKEHLHQLKHEGPQALLLEFQELQKQYPDAEAVSGNLSYLEKRKEQIQYPLFLEQGWPIGSGIVESGNKLVVEARLKGSGMHWAEEHVNPMLALRNIICSDRWKEDWMKVEAHLRYQAKQRRIRLHQSRIAAPETIPYRSLPNIDAKLMQTLKIRIEEQDLPKKPRKNPWRNFKHGKALYQPSEPPKN